MNAARAAFIIQVKKIKKRGGGTQHEKMIRAHDVLKSFLDSQPRARVDALMQVNPTDTMDERGVKFHHNMINGWGVVYNCAGEILATDMWHPDRLVDALIEGKWKPNETAIRVYLRDAFDGMNRYYGTLDEQCRPHGLGIAFYPSGVCHIGEFKEGSKYGWGFETQSRAGADANK